MNTCFRFFVCLFNATNYKLHRIFHKYNTTHEGGGMEEKNKTNGINKKVQINR